MNRCQGMHALLGSFIRCAEQTNFAPGVDCPPLSRTTGLDEKPERGLQDDRMSHKFDENTPAPRKGRAGLTNEIYDRVTMEQIINAKK